MFLCGTRQCLSGWLASDAMVVVGASGYLSRLRRRHGVKVGARSLYTMEETALAVGDVIRHGSVKLDEQGWLVETSISVDGRRCYL